MAASNIVTEWLKSLRLGQYAESFIDNGYDDLEICKQVGDPDLDAIGVFNPVHRARLLQSVRTLREEGAASVYFSLEEGVQVASSAAAGGDECFCVAEDGDGGCASKTSSDKQDRASCSSGGGGDDVAKYLDEYEEGKAELVKIPRMQLKVLLREKLQQDGIRLSCQPYSTQDGERGYLEGLASRYADLFSTHYGDVLGHLDDLRKGEVAETSSKELLMNEAQSLGLFCQGLTSSLSQPIYVPGKYLPSSCLSHKEEDEIYGFAYGVFKPQLAIQPQQRLGAPPQQTQPLLSQQQHNYQTCLSPRSAYFYEFPPNEQNYANTGKKRNTFSRIQRIFKTSHRKEKHGSSSPRHGRAASRGVPQRVDTPDSVLQSGLGLTDLGQHAVLRSMVDPLDYDRLRHLQMNGGTPNTFEETIYKLKVQEALRKREKFTKEHEEILRDIKQGLLQLGKEGIRGPLSTADDTYMYDEDARMLQPMAQQQQHHHNHLHHHHDPRLGHWYDEPPYESDPEDFLMGGGPQATIQNGRVCFTLNVRPDQKSGEGVISLRSAGDISLPREVVSSQTPRRGLILPREAGYPPTIIPLRSSRDRESGDYAGSDVQSVSSRLSTLSMDTSRSEIHEMTQMISPQYYTHLDSKMRHFRRTNNNYPRSEDGLSPSQSSDYEDQDDYSNCSQQVATVHVSSDGRSSGVSSLVGKVRGLREDVQRKISRLKGEEQRVNNEQTYTCSASSVESIPSGSGSSTQALVRAGSNHSSISTEEVDASPVDQIVGRARALVDQTPSPYDKDVLKFKAGDIIDIVSMNASGQWRGACHGRKGTFKFINVELMSERAVKAKREIKKWHRNIKGKPVSVEDLLQKINLPEYISVFVLNGYEDLELFKEIEPSDLDYLGIVNSDHRAKILTAVQLLHELDSGSEGDVAGSSSEGDDHHRGGATLTAARLHAMPPFSRRQYLESEAAPTVDVPDNRNNLDSVVEQCNNEILARVRQAQKKEEPVSYEGNTQQAEKKTKDSYVGVHGQTSLVDPCKRGILATKKKEEFCEADQKFHSVKYVVGSEMSEQGSLGILGKSCLSEKSSDSGVSSSSLSSTVKDREARPPMAQLCERSNICANSNATSNTANK